MRGRVDHPFSRRCLLQIGYFKIRDCSIAKLPDYLFMGIKITHLLIYNCGGSSICPSILSYLFIYLSIYICNYLFNRPLLSFYLLVCQSIIHISFNLSTSYTCMRQFFSQKSNHRVSKGNYRNSAKTVFHKR